MFLLFCVLDFMSEVTKKYVDVKESYFLVFVFLRCICERHYISNLIFFLGKSLKVQILFKKINPVKIYKFNIFSSFPKVS